MIMIDDPNVYWGRFAFYLIACKVLLVCGKEVGSVANEGHPAKTYTSWRRRIKAASTTLIQTLFPPTCANCRQVGSMLCADCQAQLKWLEDPICGCCGRTVSYPTSLCKICVQRPLLLKQIRAAVLFEEPIAVVIHKMKYEGLFGLAEPLADLMTRAWEKWYTPVDLILPIPLHPDREKKRGYNQSNLLAKRLGTNLNLEVDFKVIHRARYTPAQVGLTARERLANVSGAFVVLSQKAIGKDVLLIDDVCTTGATMSAAAQALLEGGASSVSGYCVARAV